MACRYPLSACISRNPACISAQESQPWLILVQRSPPVKWRKRVTPAARGEGASGDRPAGRGRSSRAAIDANGGQRSPVASVREAVPTPSGGVDHSGGGSPRNGRDTMSAQRHPPLLIAMRGVTSRERRRWSRTPACRIPAAADCDPPRRWQADEHEVVGPAVALDDLVRDTAEDAPHVVGCQEQALAGQEKTSRVTAERSLGSAQREGGLPRRRSTLPPRLPSLTGLDLKDRRHARLSGDSNRRVRVRGKGGWGCRVSQRRPSHTCPHIDSFEHCGYRPAILGMPGAPSMKWRTAVEHPGPVAHGSEVASTTRARRRQCVWLR